MSRENNKVPRLRFPEFRDAGDWEEKRLGNLSEIVRGGSPRPIDGFLTKDRKGLNWLKIGDVSKNSKYVTRTQERVRIEALSKTREVNPGDLILSNSMSFGRPYILQIKSCIHDGWIAITQIDNKIDRDYLYYLILSPSSQAYFSNNAAGSGVQNLNADIIKSLSVLSPTLPEQQKIADCLSSLDDLITAQTQKLAHLKTHKKGLMQQLFPAEGETLPKLRFPEFRNAGDWEEKEGNLVFEQISNKKHDSNLPVLAITQEYGAIPRVLIDFHVSVTDKSIKNYKVVEEGDFIISLRTFQGGIEHSKYKGICSPAYVILRKSQSNSRISISGGFFKYYFKTGKFIRDLSKNIEGLRDGKMVSYKQFSALMLPIPLVEEQQKIAACLSSLDELITAQTQKLAQLKTHKKGLMQQLFPAADEVNG